eukprot:13005796-Alexandrium_andersonii.AAC.1
MSLVPFTGIHGMVRGSQHMDLSDLSMSSPSQLFRATRETCAQFGFQRLFVLLGLPDTLRPAYLSASDA